MGAKWDAKRARQLLLEERDRLAKGDGTSDRTFGRIAALADSDAAESRDAFLMALERGGLSETRRNAALKRVEHTEHVEQAVQVQGRSRLASVAQSVLFCARWLVLLAAACTAWKFTLAAIAITLILRVLKLEYSDKSANAKAVYLAQTYGTLAGERCKAWVIDQMVRVLLGDGYDVWRAEQDANGEPKWNEGAMDDEPSRLP